jgi:hypothetical protein
MGSIFGESSPNRQVRKILKVGGIQRLISDIETVELDLRERKKELEFFFAFSKLIDDCGDSMEEICAG